MIDLNTMCGDETEVIRAKLEAVVEFRVGGESHEDRVDSVSMLLDDHYEDIVKNSFLGGGITSLTTEILDQGMTGGEAIEKIEDILGSDMPEREMLKNISETIERLKGRGLCE